MDEHRISINPREQSRQSSKVTSTFSNITLSVLSTSIQRGRTVNYFFSTDQLNLSFFCSLEKLPLNCSLRHPEPTVLFPFHPAWPHGQQLFLHSPRVLSNSTQLPCLSQSGSTLSLQKLAPPLTLVFPRKSFKQSPIITIPVN